MRSRRSSFAKLAELESALQSTIRGKAEAVRLSLVCLLARGHLLIEDVPGVGKTTLAQALARSVDCTFHRLQFTSDMLPSDVLGVTIYNAHSETFEFKPGPIFSNFLLADEINRTTPKTQSALLEAMNESQVTIDGHSHALPQPFMVIATQNPVEHHGTYPLPESQLDRFLMRLRIGYPDAASEREILRNFETHHAATAARVLEAEQILELQALTHRVTVDESLVDYMLAIVEKTRTHDAWRWASARAARRRCFARRRRWRWSKAAITPFRTTSSAWPCPFSRIAWWSTPAPRWRSAAPTWATASSKKFSA